MADSIKYAFYVLFHPFDGFWDLKHEKRGTVRASILFLGGWFLTNVLSQIGTGFLFNTDFDVPLNIFREFRSVFLLFLLFCVGNWSVTTLMDGKGRFSDIVQVFGYASLPMTLLGLLNILLSHVFNTTGLVYYNMITAASWIWFGILLFIGIMSVHDYSFMKTVGTLVLTLAAAVVIIFIVMVFYNIFSILLSFVLSVYKEISIRI
ncbi:MAG: YIP1 family protein [Clostridiales bacterium]|nr:YIP1 family protein [Clostridiales bacterium]